MPFNLIGHEWVVELLQRDLAHDRVRHTYLFTGPEGVGKRTLAAEFARALLCQQSLSEATPCGQCRHCTLVAKGSHPDLFTIAPILSGKRVRTEKIKIEPVRQLIYDLILKPVEAKRRVARLLNFDAANEQTQNALLKTLEEPPNNVVLLLTAESTEALLPTIVSRCEVIALRPLSLGTVRDALITQWMVAAEQADLLAHLSGGRLGWAARMAQDGEALEERTQKLNDLRALLRASRVERFAYAEKLARENTLDRVQDTLALWQSFWRDVLLMTVGAAAPQSGERETRGVSQAQAPLAPAPLANPDRSEDIHALARTLTPQDSHHALTALRETSELLERNINARLALEVLLLDWPRA
ncbi:MAG: DNA polymerase III subunit delta' [Anaerolineales bacterium]